MPTKWYQATVTRIVRLSETTRQFTLQLASEDLPFPFLPGQFITLDLPVGEKRLDRWRSYSIASRPDDTGSFELCIVRMDNGKGTTYLFEEVSIGHVLKFKGPDGTFVLPEDLSREIIMVCTGTGLAPFRSMLQHIDAHGLAFRKIHLIFGARKKEHILYREELNQWAEKYHNFKYSIALSREESQGCYKGYVHQVYLEKYKSPEPHRIFMLCGWSQMVDEAIVHLTSEAGYEKSQIKYELYG